MLGIVLNLVVFVTLMLSLFTGVYALFRSQSSKKNYFLLIQAMLVVYTLAYFLELTSAVEEEALLSIKILDITAAFAAVFSFFFVSGYCNVKLHPLLVKVPMLLLPAALVPLIWGAKSSLLVYKDYTFVYGLSRHLEIIPGPLYFITYSYPIVCMLLAFAVLLHRMKTWKNKYRKQLLILAICVIIPLASDAFYCITILSGMLGNAFFFTPQSLLIMNICLCLGVFRYNIFDIITPASVAAMDHIREGFIFVDDENNYLFSNPAAALMFPGLMKLEKGESIFSISGWPSDLKDLKSGSIDFSVFDKGTKHYRASVSAVFTHSKTLIAKTVLLCDITENVALLKKLENAAYIDALTGLYNRKHFLELASLDIERAQRQGHSIFTAMLDLDFFKNVNDTYGHFAGDMILKGTAGIIRQTIRSYDLLGRYGGEEFVFLIADLDAHEALNLMERIRENIENSITHYESNEIKITSSIGLAKFGEGDTLESSIKKADVALYEAKNSGRNMVKIYGSAS